MNTFSKVLTGTLLALSVHSAFAGDVEHNTQAFLDALNSGSGKPIEQLSPKDARAVLVGAQSGVKLTLPKADVSEKSIQVDGQPLSLTIVRPAGVKGELPVFMFFHGGGWVLGDFPTHERLVRDLVGDGVEGAAFGAALQAVWALGHARGEATSIADIADQHVALDPLRSARPDPARMQAYATAYARFLGHLDAITPLYRGRSPSTPHPAQRQEDPS